MAHTKVTALNTISGKVGSVPSTYIDHPVLGKYLVEVPEGTKDYDPEFFQAGTADEHKQKATSKRKSASDKPADEPEVIEQPDLGF